MIKKICKQCGNEFETIPSRIRNGRGKYCSRKCFHEFTRNKEIRVCQKCGNEFEAHLSDIKRGRGKFCSKSCAQTRENNANWQGGISFEPYCILFNNEFKERVREFWEENAE
jgi:hypothetical protein